jgi:hypothetical protein
MTLFGIFSNPEVQQFAEALATDLNRRFPPSSEARTDTGAKRQLEVILDGLSNRAIRFQQDNRLGIYGKAKLGNSFRWKLNEYGYSKAFIDGATKKIVTRIAARSSAPDGTK